ncbi:MAG: glycosyl hydrolase [Terracidiphilus sp.]
MRLNPFLFVPILMLGLSLPARAAAAPPVNPHASPEARALLAYLDSISGKGILTGQHNYPNDGSRWTDLAYDLTAKYPGLFGQDFGFSAGDDKDSVLSRPAMIEEAERQYKNGAVIALTWHEVRPTDDEPVTFHESVQGHLTDYEWRQLLTPGTPLYNRWCAQVDVVAGYLRQLRDAHIPVLFRPYHEMNGGWFWWGGRPGKDGSAALYRQIYDRFVNVHHLDNLVWVWNVNAPNPDWPPIADYYPDAQFADVVTIDIYGEFKQEYYDSMVALAAGKPIALAEVGYLPSVEVLNQQPRWTYFMEWSEWIHSANTVDQANAVFHAPQAINRDDARLAGPMAAIRKATIAVNKEIGLPDAEPVSTGATAEAYGLLARLLAAPGQGVLSGQEDDPVAPRAASLTVKQVTGKRPALWASELGVGGPDGASVFAAREAIIKAALDAHANHAVVSLIWHAARPTDGAPASAHGQLTDYEWSELLTPGTNLNLRWSGQEDDVAATLRALEKAGVAVLFNPLPESNGKDFWWAGRKGFHGSAELYRQLFDRLVQHDGLHNLVWVWEAAAPDYRPGGAGMVTDFFPGLLYTDALELSASSGSLRFGAERILSGIATGKVTGVDLAGELPAPDALAGHASWAWFVAAPQSPSPARDEALRMLYADPRIVSLTPAQ